MSKLGRPKEQNPRAKIISVRLTEDEFNKLKTYTETHNQTMTQTIVNALEKVYKRAKSNQ